MVFKVFRAKWYYQYTGILIPLLFGLVWIFYTAMAYFSTFAQGVTPALQDLAFYGTVTAFCVLFSIAGLQMWWASSIRIVVGNGRITYLRKKYRAELKLSEIQKVEYSRGFPFPGLKLSSGSKTIKVFKDIEGYGELYDMLRQNVPILSASERRPLPEKLLASNEVLAIAMVLILMASATVVTGVTGFILNSVSLVIVSILIGLTAAIFGAIKLYPWLNRPYMYIFTPSSVTACMLLRQEELNRLLIKQIRLGETYRKAGNVKAPIKAVFIESSDGKTFTIEDGQSRYPIEEIYGMLKQTYKQA